MDILNFTTNNDKVIELVNPVTGEPLLDEKKKPLSITVMSKHSKEYRLIEREIGFRAKKLKEPNADKMEFNEFSDAYEEVAALGTEFLARTVTACNLVMNSKALKANKDDMVAVFSDERTAWVREQVESANADTEAFTKG